jgi:molybdate-binding protein
MAFILDGRLADDMLVEVMEKTRATAVVVMGRTREAGVVMRRDAGRRMDERRDIRQ